jgi:hypothetical protein
MLPLFTIPYRNGGIPYKSTRNYNLQDRNHPYVNVKTYRVLPLPNSVRLNTSAYIPVRFGRMEELLFRIWKVGVRNSAWVPAVLADILPGIARPLYTY